MKEFGVYVKFLNADEFKSIGGLNEYDENVIGMSDIFDNKVAKLPFN